LKHILFAHRKLSFGGGERVLVEQIASLAHVPVEISVLFRKEKRRRDLESEIRQRNPHVVAIEYRPSVWGVYRWIKTHRPDVVVLCNHKGAMFALLLLALQGVKIPLLVTLHEHYPRHLRRYRWIARWVDAWICTYDFSLAVRRELSPASCYIMHPIYLDHLPQQRVEIHEASRQEARALWSIPSDALVMGYCGQVDSRKDPHAFIQLGVCLEAALGRPVTLLLAGRIDPLFRDQIRSYAKKSRLRGSLIMTGALEHFDDAFRCLDLFALTSRNEGFFPISLVESLFYGVPIVAPTVGGIEAVARGHRGVFLIDKEDDRQAIPLSALKKVSRQVAEVLQHKHQWDNEKKGTADLLLTLIDAVKHQPTLESILAPWI